MDLSTLTPALKRTVAAPGEFDTYFPEASPGDLTGCLADAAAEARLDGFMPAKVIDPLTLTLVPDPNTVEQALIVLYAAARILSARLSNLKNRTRFKAGNVEAEQEQAATVITELLRAVNARKKQLLDDLRSGSLSNGPDGLESTIGMAGSTGFGMADLYALKRYCD